MNISRPNAEYSFHRLAATAPTGVSEERDLGWWAWLITEPFHLVKLRDEGGYRMEEVEGSRFLERKSWRAFRFIMLELNRFKFEQL